MMQSFCLYDKMPLVIELIIYLIRHAQTVHNKKGKVFSGVSDVALSEKGKKEAEKFAKLDFLSNVEKIYITPLRRTRQTADIIFGKEREKTVIKALEEMNFGDYEGRVLDEDSKSDDVFIKWMNDPENLVFPGGDSFKEHAEEAFEAFKAIAQGNEGKIAIVSHRTTIRLILTQLLGRELSSFREIPCDNCSAARIVYENGCFTVEEMNIKA